MKYLYNCWKIICLLSLTVSFPLIQFNSSTFLIGSCELLVLMSLENKNVLQEYMDRILWVSLGFFLGRREGGISMSVTTLGCENVVSVLECWNVPMCQTIPVITTYSALLTALFPPLWAHACASQNSKSLGFVLHQNETWFLKFRCVPLPFLITLLKNSMLNCM